MSTRAFLIILFVFAFSIRFGATLVLPEKVLLLSDSREYRDIAINIAAGDGVILHEGAKAKRPPGYPLFLSLSEKLFPGKQEVLFLSQAFLGGGLCVLVFLIGRITVGKTVAVLAALLCAVYPLLIYSGSSLLIEPLYSILFIFEIFFLIRAQGEWKYGWLAGLAGGLASLVQAGHILFFLPVLLYRRGKYAVPYLVTFLFVISLWSWRNREVLGEWVPITTQSGYTLYESMGPDATGGTVGSIMKLPPQKGLGEVAYDRLLRDLAWENVTPNRFLSLALQKQKRFWSVVPNAEGMKSGMFYFATLCFLPILFGFMFALLKWRRIREEAGWLLLPIAYTATLHLIFLGSIRYRLAVEPFLILLACWGVSQFIQAGALSGRGAVWLSPSGSSD